MLESNRSYRILNILDNLTLITDRYEENQQNEESLTNIAKNTNIILNDIPFSYYYLMHRKFNYINKYHVPSRTSKKILSFLIIYL